jgi:hypothetical protein
MDTWIDFSNTHPASHAPESRRVGPRERFRAVSLQNRDQRSGRKDIVSITTLPGMPGRPAPVPSTWEAHDGSVRVSRHGGMLRRDPSRVLIAPRIARWVACAHGLADDCQ